MRSREGRWGRPDEMGRCREEEERPCYEREKRRKLKKLRKNIAKNKKKKQSQGGKTQEGRITTQYQKIVERRKIQN